MDKAAFLDRDGVINRKAPEGDYITRWEDMEILPGVAEGIALLNRGGFKVILATNQRCIARGLVTSAEVEALHEQMRGVLAANGARIDAIYYCPHDKQPKCDCRKPEPGMLLRAAQDHAIDLGNSWMIGDSAADVEAGRRAGCKTALVTEPGMEAAMADVAAGSLLECARKIVAGSRVHTTALSGTNPRIASALDLK